MLEGGAAVSGPPASAGAGSPPPPRGGAGPALSPRVVIACVPGGLRTEVVDAAHRSGLPVHIMTHSPDLDGGYAELLMELWRAPHEWVLCEQDTAPPEGALTQMVECEREWCTLPHWVGTHWETRSLGVARFSLALRRRFPNLMEQAVGRKWVHGPLMDWRVCDTEIARQMEMRRLDPHVHAGHTRHLHQYGV